MTASTAVLQRIMLPYPPLIAVRDDLYRQLRALQKKQGRKAPKPADDERFKEALLSFLHAIATIALSQIPPHDGIAVAFGENRYIGGLSPTALRDIRKGLDELGFIAVLGAFNDREGKGRGKFTRIRHTAKLSDLLRAHGVRLSDLVKPPEDVIRLSRPKTGVMPQEVADTADFIRDYNAYISQFDLSLPQEAWRDLFRIIVKGGTNGKGDKLHRGYNDGHIYLWRGFAEDYSRGGRFYGQVQQNMPKVIRERLLIDGKPTVERDFSRIHPTIIFAEKGLSLDRDPYAVPGYENMEEAGKETFNRLLNSRKKVQYRIKEDRKWFADRDDFNRYRDAMISHLSVISDTFQKDYGARLQKRDSELAMKIILRCMAEGFPVYPVHDSFIAPSEKSDQLDMIMKEEFASMFGVSCTVK